MTSSPEQLFADRLAADRAQPFVTYYDQRTGERAELSAASLANWVTKTYFLLTDELALQPGDRAAVRLPVHWMRYVVLLGVWAAGLTIDEQDPSVAFAHDPADLNALAPAADVFGLALAAWGNGYPGPAPAGAADFVAAVRPQADDFRLVQFAATPQDPALPERSRAELTAAAVDRAGALRLAEGGRLLLRDDRTGAQDAETWLAPLTVHGSIVLLTGADDESAERIAAAERVTAVAD